MRPVAKRADVVTAAQEEDGDDAVTETQAVEGEDDAAYEDGEDESTAKNLTKSKASSAKEALQKPKKKVSATANANYRALKIKNKNSKGKGGGGGGRRFGRR